LDGIRIVNYLYEESQPPTPHWLDEITGEHNARQGLTWSAGRGLVVENSTFRRNGRSTLSSPPSAGIQIEAENGDIRDGRFVNVEVVDNVGYGVGTVGNVAGLVFEDCLFWGTSTYSAHISVPYLEVHRSKFVGTPWGILGNSNPLAAAKFHHTRFTDIADPSYPGLGVFAAGGELLVEFNQTMNSLVQDSIFESTWTKWLWFPGGTMVRSRIIHNNVYPKDPNDAGAARGAVHGATWQDVAVLFPTPIPAEMPQYYHANPYPSMTRVYTTPNMFIGAVGWPTGCIGNPGVPYESCVFPIQNPELIPD
jgi:hypothetical protein